MLITVTKTVTGKVTVDDRATIIDTIRSDFYADGKQAGEPVEADAISCEPLVFDNELYGDAVVFSVRGNPLLVFNLKSATWHEIPASDIGQVHQSPVFFNDGFYLFSKKGIFILTD